MDPQIPNELDTINVYKIVEAGKALKNVVFAVLIMITSSVIGVIIAVSSRNVGEMTTIYIIIGLVSLICNIVILIQLYSAGENLEKVQSIQHQLVSVHSSPCKYQQN